MNKKIQDEINNLMACDKCRDVKIKKFTPITEYKNYDKLNKDYLRCECGKRPIDIVMAHILKIMIEEETILENATLRKDTPIPMPVFCYSNLNPQFINENGLILIHYNFDEKVAKRLVNEVKEVKGVLKGDISKIVGIVDKDSEVSEFRLLSGDSNRIDVLRTLIDEQIIISKNQQNSHIEVAQTTEEKLLKVYNYLENSELEKNIAIDCMCGSGAIGIFLLKYGFKKVIFNDINPQAIENLKENLKLNNINEDSYEIYNEPIEDLVVEYVDLAIIDAFPGVNTQNIEEKVKDYSAELLKI